MVHQLAFARVPIAAIGCKAHARGALVVVNNRRQLVAHPGAHATRLPSSRVQVRAGVRRGYRVSLYKEVTSLLGGIEMQRSHTNSTANLVRQNLRLVKQLYPGLPRQDLTALTELTRTLRLGISRGELSCIEGKWYV